MAVDERAVRGRRRWLLWISGGLLALIAGGVVAGVVVSRRAEPFLRARIVEGLAQRFHSRVELESLRVTLGRGLRGEWGVWAEGHGLRIWPPGEAGGEPLYWVERLAFSAPLRYRPGVPIDIGEVDVTGLAIHLPPHSHTGVLSPAPGTDRTRGEPLVKLHVGSIDVTDADLVLERSRPGKLPLEFAIAHLRLRNVGLDNAMPFEAELTNPRPVGSIRTSGILGPWQVDDPGGSRVDGSYHLDHADLATINGIGGILSSVGRYRGTLRDIEVNGETETPDFHLAGFENTAPLHTTFHAIVDGTSGDTWLDPVDARLGRSHVVARGQVVRVLAPARGLSPHSIGHSISLRIRVDRGRIEDFLRLVNHDSTPLMKGDVILNTGLEVPPGHVPVTRRMTLAGTFSLARAEFTSEKVQSRIAELSLRGQGRPGERKTLAAASVASEMQGSFRLGQGLLTLPALTFKVPGADVAVHGTYTLDGGQLDFSGKARMDATVSKMVGGWEGLLLKPADRLFRKDGAGTEVPIFVRGTRQAPDFGLDFKQLKHTSPERPDQRPGPPDQAPRSLDSPS